MAIELLTERHGDQIAGVLGCWDRMLIFGTLPKICFARGMTSFLFERNIRIFDYPRFAEPFRNRIRENAEKLAADTGIEIEFIRKRNFRKEDRVKQALAKRGEHPGLICIFSAMEPCSTYKPWHNKQTGKTYLMADDGKCLHYYFYFIDEELGLCYVACRHGYPAGCRSTSMATTGWPVSCVSRVSNIGSSTTPLSKSRTGHAPSGSPMDGQPNVSTESWTSSRAGTVRFIAISRRDITGAPTSASTPPISFSANRRTCRLSTRTWRAPLFTPSSPTTSQRFGRKLSTQFEGEMGNR